MLLRMTTGEKNAPQDDDNIIVILRERSDRRIQILRPSGAQDDDQRKNAPQDDDRRLRMTKLYGGLRMTTREINLHIALHRHSEGAERPKNLDPDDERKAND